MRRAWLLLSMLAGCDVVYGLEGRVPPEARPGDEDGDGTLDEDDPCPHIANETVDEDRDGVAVECDPDDTNEKTMVRWFPLTAGALDDVFVLEGVGRITADGFQLGSHGSQSWLVFDGVIANTVQIDVGYAILSNVIENDREQPWAELGVHTVFRGTSESARGAVCFLGIGQDLDEDPPVIGEPYLETKEDDATRSTVHFAGALNGIAGRLYQARTPERVSCGALHAMETTTTSYDVESPALEGGFAISADRVVAMLTHIWIAWQPIVPPSGVSRP